MKSNFFLIIFCSFLLNTNIYAQDSLYTNTFPLSDVVLLDGPFKHARDINIQTLLQYDVDRLYAGYRKIAGLSAKALSFSNWDGLDGHVGGHYLSAMALNYAATGNSDCKERMDYIISELKTCQDSNATKYPSWGVGYVGAVPNSDLVWSNLKNGNFSEYQLAWVPWYNIHKMYAGLRDAWLYGGSNDAKIMFLKFCDWGINITSGLSDSQINTMLNTEHGGMNEIFADAYQITGDEKYLDASKKFSHKTILNAMAAHNDNLDNLHANTQVPKAVGFQRIAELSEDSDYTSAGKFFWETVSQNRSLAFGGNSRREHFPTVSACSEYVDEVQGPESCNTYNMLKLTEDLFRVTPLAEYADFYERALYNHILSAQHPDHGGYVYFTPARPRHYRVYSAPNQAMWCCVGTGMENHSKYGQFIYTHYNDSLFLNLFIASELNWEEKGIKIKQETDFPNEEITKLTITEGSLDFTLMVRYPSWVASGALKIIVNGDTLSYTSEPSSYIDIDRSWLSGDSIKIILPMQTRIERLINVPEYIAFMHGPILLGAKTGTGDLTGLIADDGRWSHIASGVTYPVDKAPIIVSDDLSSIDDKISPVDDEPMSFTFTDITIGNPVDLTLEPFYQIHDARYMIYWLTMTSSEYEDYLNSEEEEDLNERTIDSVEIGVTQSEEDHGLLTSNSYSGSHMGENWRDARDGGYFSYNLATKSESNLSLWVRYWGSEGGYRTFDILVDDAIIATENVTGKWNDSEFHNVEYAIPDSLIKSKDKVCVKFQAPASGYAGGIFGLRMLRPIETSVTEDNADQPISFRLYQNHPNPFNLKTSIRFSLPQTSDVLLEVYNSLGQKVKTLFNSRKEAGWYTIKFNAFQLASGVYYCRIQAGDFNQVKKMLLIK